MLASKSKILEYWFAAAKFEISFGSCCPSLEQKQSDFDAVCQTSWQNSVQRIGFNDLKIAFTYKTAFCGDKAAKMKTITKLPLFFKSRNKPPLSTCNFSRLDYKHGVVEALHSTTNVHAHVEAWHSTI